MSDPVFDHITPGFKVGKFLNILVNGSGFSQDDGNGGFAQIVVDLEDSNKVFQWTQQKAHPPVLLDETKILVRAKAVRVKGAAHTPKASAGSSDLTITVTNGDGSATAPQSTVVLYDESSDT